MEVLRFENFAAYAKIKKDWYAVIEEITFSVEEGEFVVICGPSGCGKTTLLRCALGLIKNTSGGVYLFGKDVYKTDISKCNLAYVSQEYGLYPSMTVYENIAYPLRAMHCPLSEIDERVKSIAAQFELSPFLTRKPRQLSGGQHQKIAIARALVKNPRLVLFDEPFSNLDTPLRMEMDAMIKQLHKERGITFLFVTHNQSEALSLADRIIIMDDGKIERIAAPAELKKGWI